jgi:hypothetical protein
MCDWFGGVFGRVDASLDRMMLMLKRNFADPTVAPY